MNENEPADSDWDYDLSQLDECEDENDIVDTESTVYDLFDEDTCL